MKKISTGMIILLSAITIIFAALVPNWQHQFAMAGNYSDTAKLLLILPSILSSNNDKFAPE